MPFIMPKIYGRNSRECSITSSSLPYLKVFDALQADTCIFQIHILHTCTLFSYGVQVYGHTISIKIYLKLL